jgi:hypothetical protein
MSMDSPASGGGPTVAEEPGPSQDARGERTPERPESREPALSLDLVFEILKNCRRRMVLEELDAADGEVSIGELSEVIAARENDKGVDEISSEERKRVYVGLYQCHLPKMHDAGVVEFNKDRGRIAPGEHAGLLDQYLARARPEPTDGPEPEPADGPWLAVTAVTGALLGASLLVGRVGGVSAALLSLAGVACLLAAVTALHRRD